MAKELQKIMDSITEWSSRTFIDEIDLSKLRHLEKEVNELCDALIENPYHGNGKFSVRHEYADCFILLFGAAALSGFTANDILNAVSEKLEINKKRKWGKPDENGVVEHIRE